MKSPNSKPSDVDVYGLRPLVSPWKCLSPYEFYMHWKAEALLPPTFYNKRDMPQRTAWVQPVPKDVIKGEKAAVPGVHYVVLDAPEGGSNDTYYCFPEEPAAALRYFRHAWVLVRKKRPEVPVIEGGKLPRAGGNATYNAKYASVFFRPWCLLKGCVNVPHLCHLGCTAAGLSEIYRYRVVEKPTRRISTGKPVRCSDVLPYFEKAWDEYIKGNVVSKHAAQLIQSFLLNTIAATQYEADEAHDVEGDLSEAEDEKRQVPRDADA